MVGLQVERLKLPRFKRLQGRSGSCGNSEKKTFSLLAEILSGWLYNMSHPLSAPQTISGQWKDLEGQSVGAFTLHSYVGGSDQTAVFSTTRSNGEKAAIKLLPCDSRTSDLKLSRLQQAIWLSHPNLLKIYDSGAVELQ